MKTKGSIKQLIVDYGQSKTRSQKWDFLYATEYSGESCELNEAMAAMTDDQVDEWFDSVASEYIYNKIKAEANGTDKSNS
jgi:hypothetical protein